MWTADTGLPENSVNTLVQTRDGYLWMGTYEGLVRFDGVRFSVFDRASTPGLTANGIYRLLETRDGSLWIGTNGGGLVRWRDGAVTAFRAGGASGLRSDVVRTLYEDRDGTLWVGTDAGLHRRAGEGFVAYSTKEGLPHDAVRAILEDRRGRLWIGTAGGGLARLEQGVFHLLAKRHGLAHDVVRAILEDRKGRLWIGTGAGLNRLDGDVLSLVSTKDGLTSDIVTALHEDREGGLWVGTNGGGVNLLRNGTVVPLAAGLALGDAIVAAFLEDREGSLWIGTYLRGLHRLRPSAFVPLTTREGLPHDIVKGVHEGRDGALWIATNGGGVARLEGGRISTLSKKTHGLSGDIVLTAYEDRRGDLWLGTYLEGLDRVRKGRVTVYRTRDGLANDHVTALLEDRAGRLWVGTYGSGLNVLEDGRLSRLGTAEGLSNGVVRTLLEGRDGSLWVGTNDGLNRIRGAEVTRYTTRDGLSSSAVVALHEDEGGGLWIGTRGGGLNRLKDGRFEACTTREGLFNDVVYAVLDDGRGYFWMSCDKGLFRVRKQELLAFMDGRAASVTSDSFGREDGLPANQCSGGSYPAAWRARDGTLWFPTIRGLVGVDPARIEPNAVPPPVAVERVVSGRLAVEPRGAVTLPPGTSQFEVHYTALSFLLPERVRFRYRLEGFDPDWVEAGARRTAYYTNVPPGEYAFRVLACNKDGVWNETGASLAVVLEPRFYQTRTAYALGLLAVGFVAAGAYRLRVRQLRRRAQQLEALVAERTRELRGANALRSELLQIAAHDLKTPLQLVMGYAELITASLHSHPDVRERAERIVESSRRMLGLVTRLVETAALEGRSFPLAQRPVDVSWVAEAVVRASTAAAERKGQSLTFAGEEGCLVVGDEERLREVLDNLVSNALKFSPAGKPVRVTVRRNGDAVRAEVADEGPGLTADDRTRLFGKFQRLSARPTGGESSSGLGLSIVKQLVELHGGRAWAESAGPGQGATFFLELPARRRDA